MILWKRHEVSFDVDAMDRQAIVDAFVDAGHRDILPEEFTGDYIQSAQRNVLLWSRAWETLLEMYGPATDDTSLDFDRDLVTHEDED